MSKGLRKIGKAADESKKHMERMLEEEAAAFEQGKTGAGA